MLVSVLFSESAEKLSRLAVVWVDQGYSGPNFERAVKQVWGETVQVGVIERESKGFEVLPKRWIVELYFGWMNRYRRLSKDYEMHVENSESMIFGVFIRLMVRRLATYRSSMTLGIGKLQ